MDNKISIRPYLFIYVLCYFLTQTRWCLLTTVLLNFCWETRTLIWLWFENHYLINYIIPRAMPGEQANPVTNSEQKKEPVRNPTYVYGKLHCVGCIQEKLLKRRDLNNWAVGLDRVTLYCGVFRQDTTSWCTFVTLNERFYQTKYTYSNHR